jgi:hypothetical protein
MIDATFDRSCLYLVRYRGHVAPSEMSPGIGDRVGAQRYHLTTFVATPCHRGGGSRGVGWCGLDPPAPCEAGWLAQRRECHAAPPHRDPGPSRSHRMTRARNRLTATSYRWRYEVAIALSTPATPGKGREEGGGLVSRLFAIGNAQRKGSLSRVAADSNLWSHSEYC